MSLVSLLAGRLAAAVPDLDGFDPRLRRSGHADFQANAAFELARRQRVTPREAAAQMVAAARLDDLCTRVEVSGPGFVNLTVDGAVLGQMLAAMATDDRLGVAPVPPETVVVDYSGPNVAKELHVGHLRSTVIGDTLVRLLEWLGHRVVRANHLGDWGTPFGMLIEHLLDTGEARTAGSLGVGDLGGFYAAARATFDASAGFRERSRRRVVALQAGDPATLRLWRLLVGASVRYCTAVYERLGVRLVAGDFVGESTYNDDLPRIVADLDRLGLLRTSDGAACAFPPGCTGRDGRPLPLIVRKRDGGYGYAATDLAALRHRVEVLGATRLLYVVGHEQRQHFAMVFATATGAGWLAPPVRATHVGFGMVLGPGGKVLSSRDGGAVTLGALLDEAVARARVLVAAKNPGLAPPELDRLAEAVGIGAVKYADLSTDRVKDSVFDFDRMLALDGDTAPYLQYAHARIHSIFRRGGVAHRALPDMAPVVAEPAERALAIELLAFPDVVDQVGESLQPHRLAGYLHDVATSFTAFYERCPVLRAPDAEARDSRLRLCGLTARVLATGLGLLGISAPERM